MNLKQAIMRLNVVAYEEIQIYRKNIMNQIRDIIRKRDQGIEFDAVEDKKEKKAFDKKYSDAKLLEICNRLIEEGKIMKEEASFLVSLFEDQKPLISQIEHESKKNLSKLVKYEPIYIEFLDKIRGIDKVLSAKLVKELGDCSNFDTVSKLWAYCGQSVIDGIAPQRRKGKSISYNPTLRSLVWIVSDCLMKANKGYYRQIYDTEKDRQKNQIFNTGELHTKYPQKKKDGKGFVYPESATQLTKGHIHARALRKMRKIFLDHYWHCARELVGLPAQKNYVEGVLNHNHIVTWKQALEMENGDIE